MEEVSAWNTFCSKCGSDRWITDLHLQRWAVWPGWCALTAGTAFVTIHLCWLLARVYNMPDWMAVPPISFTGCFAPEREVYAIGFTLTAFAGFVSLRQLKALTEIDGSGFAGEFSLFSLGLALVAMLVQAWVPLQHDIFDALQDLTEISIQTIVHLVFATVFFIASLLHGVAVIFGRARNNPLGLNVRTKATLLLLAFTFLCVISQILEELEALHSYELFEVESLCQRAGVICILLFLADFSRDISKLHRDSQGLLTAQ